LIIPNTVAWKESAIFSGWRKVEGGEDEEITAEDVLGEGALELYWLGEG
jgi:hypothetical protein